MKEHVQEIIGEDMAGVEGLSGITQIWCAQGPVGKDLEMNGESLKEGVMGQTDGGLVSFLEG